VRKWERKGRNHEVGKPNPWYGATVTIHKRIHQLVVLGLVTLEAQAADSRRCLIVPGKLAMTYFANVAKVLRKTAARWQSRLGVATANVLKV
jgi:hypothetical protein